MYGYIQFPEDYFHVTSAICKGLKDLRKDVVFRGLAIRRKTICAKLDAVAGELGVESYEWLNDIETRILASPFDPSLMERLRERFGSEELRFILDSDRDLSPGYVSGAKTLASPFQRIVNESDETRWKYVIGLLAHFLKDFEARRPNFILVNEVTFAWEAAIYVVAKNLGIPCLNIAYMRASKVYCVSDDRYGGLSARDSLYKRSSQDPSLLEKFLPEAKRRLDAFRDRQEDPSYMLACKRRFKESLSLRGLAKRLAYDLGVLAAVKLKLFGTRGVLRQYDGGPWLLRSLEAFCAGHWAMRTSAFESPEPYFGSNYIFYPLHYEPESSTSVAAHEFSNQLALIEQLSKNMPFGFRLLVKEHLPSLGLRPKGFYERLRRIPDVHLISPFANVFEITKRAKLVVVLTGSAGWEAIQLGVPAMVFGHAEYTGIEAGFTRGSSIVDFAKAIAEAMATPPATDSQLARFIAAELAYETALDNAAVTCKFDSRKPDESQASIYGSQLAVQILELAEKR